jgi:cobalamin biosynthesis protein CobT
MNKPNEPQAQEQSRETNAETEADAEAGTKTETRAGEADRSDAGAGAEDDADYAGGEGLGEHAANVRRQIREGHGGELLTERLDAFGSIETVVEETKLTENQATILWGLGHNKSPGQVAEEMGVKRGTVRNVRYRELSEKFERLLDDIPKIENTLGLLEPLMTPRRERNPTGSGGQKRQGDSEASPDQ